MPRSLSIGASAWRSRTTPSGAPLAAPTTSTWIYQTGSASSSTASHWPRASTEAGDEQVGAGTRTIIGFSLSSLQAVDDRYADLVAAGYTGRQPPYDTFWGARYAVIEDPDGNHVGLMSPLDPARRSTPPAL